MDGTPFGRYRLMELLGRGGMGEVWRAFDTDTDREVAVKVLATHLAADPEFQQRFRREAKAAAMLNDPHVVPIHHYGVIEDRLYVDMRFVDGRDLGAILAEGPLETARAVSIVEQVAMALDAAHDAGMIHRDVKPSNVLVAKRDFAYLIDFGIARAASETGLTATGAAIGTWAYMAPERINGSAEVDARSDVYALACVLHECLTGQKPYPGTTFERLAGAHLFTPPPQPSRTGQGVSERFDAVIATGMAKDPHQRYQSPMELAAAAHEAATVPSRPTPVAPRPMANPTPPPRRIPPPPPSPPPLSSARTRRREKRDAPAPREPASADDFWDAVGIDPICIVTATDSFLTLRCYLNEEPLFLGSKGMINVFRKERKLRRFLVDNVIHELAFLETFDEVKAAAVDGSLRLGAIDDQNVYELDGLADDIVAGPNSVDARQLELAIELFTDVARFARSQVAERHLQRGQPLRLLADAVARGRISQRERRLNFAASDQVRELQRFVESRLVD